MTPGALKRELGLFGAIVTGLGSILGTGAFVAIGLASASWGDAVLWAIPLASVVATFNGLSSAFLAGRFPVAGGTYEYGYQTLGPLWGFSAGWMFLLAKTASAASAALGIAIYLGIRSEVAAATLIAVSVTGLVAAGLRRTTMVNAALLAGSVAGLAAFAIAGLLDRGKGTVSLTLGEGGGLVAIPSAVAFLFVAYTGYGRIATLGEEVKDPARVIPKAVVVTLALSAALYMGVAVGGRMLDGEHWGAVLSIFDSGLADMVQQPFATIVTVAAVTALAGVLLNLVLGLSRVWLAMARRGDLPRYLSRLTGDANPVRAVAAAGLLVAGSTLVGDISLAWSFSAVTVLIYYGITNLAALSVDSRRATAWAGMASCLFLSFYVPLPVWLLAVGLLALGVVGKTWLERTR